MENSGIYVQVTSSKHIHIVKIQKALKVAVILLVENYAIISKYKFAENDFPYQKSKGGHKF